LKSNSDGLVLQQYGRTNCYIFYNNGSLLSTNKLTSSQFLGIQINSFTIQKHGKSSTMPNYKKNHSMGEESLYIIIIFSFLGIFFILVTDFLFLHSIILRIESIICLSFYTIKTSFDNITYFRLQSMA
jgi:hypothetical protein